MGSVVVGAGGTFGVVTLGGVALEVPGTLGGLGTLGAPELVLGALGVSTDGTAGVCASGTDGVVVTSFVEGTDGVETVGVCGTEVVGVETVGGVTVGDVSVGLGFGFGTGGSAVPPLGCGV